MNWQQGDIALCVRDDWSEGEDCANAAGHLYTKLAPRKGTKWTVREVADVDLEMVSDGHARGIRPYLRLRGHPDVWFSSDRFRKLEPPPPQEIERIEARPMVSA